MTRRLLDSAIWKNEKFGVMPPMARKWRSFRSTGNATGAVGLGTVFALAQRFGWARDA